MTDFDPSRMVGRGTQSERRLLRQWLRNRDGDLCCWCRLALDFDYGEGAHRRPLFATVEHIIPCSKGGGSEAENLALAHRVCNQGRNSAAIARKEPS